MQMTFYKLVKVVDDPLTYLLESDISVDLSTAEISQT